MRKLMSTTMVLVALAVMAAPALAQAGQPDRDRPGADRWNMRGAGPGAMAGVPGAMLLERRAEIDLTAEQVSQIEAIQARVRQANAPRLEQLRAQVGDRQLAERPARPQTRHEMTPEKRQELREQMRARSETMRAKASELRPLMQEVRDANRAAGEQIHAVLTAEQQARVQELRTEARQEWQNRRGERRDGMREGRGQRGDRGQRGQRAPRGPRGGVR
jgi:Spy/CpxP family protein refolding chaperone